MGIKVKLHKDPYWTETDAGIDLSKSIVILLLGLLGLARLFEGHIIVPVVSGFLMIVGFFFEVVKYKGKAAAEAEKREREPHALDAVLSAAHASILFCAGGKGPGSDLRLCVYVPDPDDPDLIHQWTNYAGPANPTGKGRPPIHVRSGAVGRAMREGKVVFETPPKAMTTLDFLVTRMGFTKEEAIKMQLDRRSWAAVPIGIGRGANKTSAILYADSKVPWFWGQKEADSRKTLMLHLSVAIAKHLELA